MTTLSLSEGRRELEDLLKRALQGEDVGIVLDGRIVALRPMATSSDDDYALREYEASEAQVERAYQAIKADVLNGRESGQTKRFTGSL
jgi:antitoxin (DNA-binding transcriptional repressor) of toxin-antitoxin stability system